VRIAEADLTALRPALDAALAVERDLVLADRVLADVRQAQETRSRDAQLLAVLMRALPDSAYLLSVRRGRDGGVTAVGFAPSAAQVLAVLGRASGIARPVLRGGVTREMTAGHAIERFVVALAWHAVAEGQ
jgi:Tfp pilus assembly protein PilN